MHLRHKNSASLQQRDAEWENKRRWPYSGSAMVESAYGDRHIEAGALSLPASKPSAPRDGHWLKHFQSTHPWLYLVHGEPEAKTALQRCLVKKGWSADIAQYGQTIVF